MTVQNSISKHGPSVPLNGPTADKRPIHSANITKGSLDSCAEYFLGHSPAEMRRLMVQASVLRPITERLLHSAGIAPGMRVLDLGCGAGDVSMLAAELVGSSGSVVGIDRSPDATALAQERTRMAGLTNIEFKVEALDNFTDAAGFDGVVGRYVLIHQSDPAAFLKKAASLLRPHGVLACHEIKYVDAFSTNPQVPALELASEIVREAAKRRVASYDAAERFVEHFFNAGLPRPKLFAESIMGLGEDSACDTWFASSYLALLPQIAAMGLVADAAPSADVLEQTIRRAVLETHSQVEGPRQICAWVKL